MTHETWDLECDLVVVGYGAAGSAAALSGANAGARVLICEKQPSDRHTPSTRMSGGLVMCVNDPGQATEYLDACAGGMVPREVSAVWAARAVALPDWLAGLDGTFAMSRVGGAEHEGHPGFEAIDVYQPGNAVRRLDAEAGAGPELYAALRGAVERTSATVLWETPARRLVQDEGGRVVGVEVATPEGTRRVRATRGVILTCGGYEFDEVAKLNYLRAYPSHFYGNPGNTGDGVRMAQAVGADLWHMNQMVGRGVMHFELPDGSPQAFIAAMNPPGYVITDGDGRRFADESPQAKLLHGFYHELLHYDDTRHRYPRIPAYWFFDETRRRAGPLTYPNLGAVAVGLYDWSPDNSREIDQGWISRGETIAEAAAGAGVSDPAAAQAAVDDYNESCAHGGDSFGRPEATLVPLSTGPFYCVRLWPGGSNTTGGPRRDEQARILDPFGAPVPGLFGAGELGLATGLQYPSDGSNLSEGLCFGQVAVESALGGYPPQELPLGTLT